MKKKDLRDLSGLSTASMAKLARNKNVNTDVLVRVCKALDCDIGDICEIEKENQVMIIDNEVLRAIKARRSTRKFTGEQISSEQLAVLLDAAVWAPSGGNNQSWLFTAIQSKDVLTKLNSLVREGFQRWTPDDDYPGKLGAKEHSKREDFNFYHHAPTLIIASNKPNYENAMADCALALENIFLAAQSIGLGTCYINQLHWLRGDEGVREYLFELGIPREHTICSSAAVGFIEKETPAPPRKAGTINIVKN